MAAVIYDVPAFPGDEFPIGFPEAIGNIAGALWFGALKPTWDKPVDGKHVSRGEWLRELEYTMWVEAAEDYVDIRIALKNISSRVWEQGMAFNCVKGGDSPQVKDHECHRHWVRTVDADGKREFKLLKSLPRVLGPRPTLQFYNVEGSPVADQMPFVKSMECTPEDVTVEGWMAIQSRDGDRLIATVSRPALFLFQNMEYSCIHAAAGFGRMEPQQTSEATTRIYFVRSSLEAWHERMTREFLDL